jgi:HEAT repeat protein
LLVAACLFVTVTSNLEAHDPDVTPGQTSVAHWIRHLTGADQILREAAVVALGRMRPAPSLQVAKLLSDRSEDIRVAALEALGRMAPTGRRIVDQVIARLDDPSILVRRKAAVCLGRQGHDAVSAIPRLIAAARDEDYDLRREAVEALGRVGVIRPDLVESTLVRSLDDGILEVRASACRSLGGLGQGARGSAARVSAVMLEDPSWEVRVACVDALVQIEPTGSKTRKSLETSLKDPNFLVRDRASRLLGNPAARDQGSVELYGAMLKEGDPSLRRKAVRELARFGAAAVGLLAGATADPSAEVRIEACNSLEKIGPLAAEASAAIAGRLEDANVYAKIAAAHALGAVGPGAFSTLQVALDALDDDDWRVRQALIEAIGIIAPLDRRTIHAASKLLGDENAAVRESATRIAKRNANEPIGPGYENPN